MSIQLKMVVQMLKRKSEKKLREGGRGGGGRGWGEMGGK